MKSTNGQVCGPCQQYTDLFSPALDGLLAPREREVLDRHLEECPDCRREFEQWRLISVNLRDTIVFEVPEGFAGSIMASINKEAPGKLGLLDKWGRRQIAAAAAGFLILAGSLGAFGTLYMAKNPAGPEIAVEEPAQVNVQQPAAGTIEEPGADTSDPAGSVDNSPPASGTGSDAAVPAKPKTEVKPSGVKIATGPAALLSNKIVINSRIIKLKSSDPAVVASLAESAASDAGAGVQTLVNQAGEARTIIILHITAPDQAAASLAGRLAGFGELVENKAESKDITSDYQMALARRQELTGMIVSAGAEDQARLQSELEAVNRQIGDWNKAASETAITFWVEK